MTEAPQEGYLSGDWLSWNPESLPPSRWNTHVPFFAWVFEQVAPRLAVELGSGSGISFRPLCQVADRFSQRGRFIGIDAWRSDPSSPWDGERQYADLLEYCSTRHADVASVLRMDLGMAVAEFDDESVGVLHIAPGPRESDGSSFDPSMWLAKVEPGGVVVVTCGDDHGPDEGTTKVWQQISEHLPSTVLQLPGFVGIAERPRDGDTPTVQSLQSNPRSASALFRSLGERMDLRHVLGTEPTTAGGIQRYISQLTSTHAIEFRQTEARHSLAIKGLQDQLASTYDRLLSKSHEIGQLQNDADYLMAKLADQSAHHERSVAELRVQLEALGHTCNAHVAEINAIRNTVSWRFTKPLRLIQSVLLKFRSPAT